MVRKVGRGLWCLEDHFIVCPKADSHACAVVQKWWSSEHGRKI